MIERYKNSLLKSAFMKKKEWIWLLILLLGGGLIIWALCRDFGVIQRGKLADVVWWTDLRHKLWEASGTICEVVVAYSTMLAAVVIFYYSVIENKRLGIPYRRIVSYTVGPHTIPVLFMVVLILTIFVLVSYHISLKYTMYVCIIYILTVQTFAIIMILLSTSYEYGKRIICRIEKKRYLEETVMEKVYNVDWTDVSGHLEHAIHSEEFIPDKKDFLVDFLWIPFDRNTGMLYKGEYLWERLKDRQLLEKIYHFYFMNLQLAFQNLDGDEHRLERNQLYTGIGEFIKKFIEKSASWNVQENRIYFYVSCSGIMNGLISSEVEDSIVFCDYIFTECMSKKEMIRKQLGLMLLYQEVVYMFERTPTLKPLKIKRLQILHECEWTPVKDEEISFYAMFWDIWTRMYNISQYDKMRHFRAAMQTMCGYHNASAAISRLLATMMKKR